jgi:uncharacterized protein (UPF0332 family)
VKGDRIVDAAEQARRWASAKDKSKAAQLCRDHQLYGESVTRSYYACYQAMWAAVGDPPLGQWRHGGLINEFCRGRWTTPVLLPTALATLRKSLMDLYYSRVSVDYDANPASDVDAEFGLNIINEALQIIAHHRGWAL